MSSIDCEMLPNPFIQELFHHDEQRSAQAVRDLLNRLDFGSYQLEPQFLKAAMAMAVREEGELGALCLRMAVRLAVMRPGFFSRADLRSLVGLIGSRGPERSRLACEAVRAVSLGRPELFDRDSFLAVASGIGACKDYDCRSQLGLIGELVECRPDLVDFSLLYEIMKQNRSNPAAELDMDWDNYPEEYRMERILQCVRSRAAMRVERILANIETLRREMDPAGFRAASAPWQAECDRLLGEADMVEPLIRWHVRVQERKNRRGGRREAGRA